MRIEAVVVGNELLNGDLVDTNTATLAKLLRSLGLRLVAVQTVADDLQDLARALTEANRRADLVLVTGGLGPTEDDLTLAAASLATGLPLVRDEPALVALKERFRARGVPFIPNNAKQADHPRGATLLANAKGTAPGVQMLWNATTYFFFPGVPRELTHLAERYLTPWLSAAGHAQPYRSAMFKTFGRTESAVSAIIQALNLPTCLHVSYRAHFPEIHVGLHAHTLDAQASLSAATLQVHAALGDLIFSTDAKLTLPEVVLHGLQAEEHTLAVAESCTGGWLAKTITDIPGASRTFLEGVVTYTNASKSRRLGVPEEVIRTHGAVSAEVALAMARGIQRTAGTDWGVGITGIAGPGGGSDDKPVGTVHIAVCFQEQHTSRKLHFPFGRTRTRQVAVWSALDMLRRFTLIS